jgi:integrase
MWQGEALALEWSDVGFEAKAISVNSRKQSRTRAYSPRESDMHDRLAEVLKGLGAKQAKGRYVFSDENLEPLFPHKVWGDFRKLVKGTDSEGMGFHARRHSLSPSTLLGAVSLSNGSNLDRAGVEEMRRRHQRHFPEEKRRALSQLEYRSV